MSETHPDSTERFGVRAAAYARARPGYPDFAVAALARALDLTPGATIIDVGCGTGLSCEPFLRAGFAVIGVEPNAAMRAHAEQKMAGQRGFRSVDGRAENTGLPDSSADLLIAAQAFHWFDVPAARAEALRVLRAPARAALIWNDRRCEGSAFATGYEELLRRFCKDYLELRHRHERDDRIGDFFGGALWRTITVTHNDELDYVRLADRLNSASYVPPPGDPLHEPMMTALRQLFAATAQDGVVTMEFETRMVMGEMQPDHRPG
jgi:SAM-dependent methyltransferase